MILIKARYLKRGEVTGKEYYFYSDILVKPGDTVQIGKAHAVVTATDADEEEIAQFRYGVKKIDGKVEDE